MSSATNTKLNHLRDLLATKPHRDTIRLYLYQNSDNVLKEAVIVTLYRRWSARPPYGLTEIGIAIYSRQQVNCGLPCTPGPHAEDLLKHVWSIHLRIQSHAHLPSANSGSAEAFHFGTSVFVTHDEAMDLLDQIWHQPLDPTKLHRGYRPIIFLSFGDNDALGKIRNTAFDFIPGKIDTTVVALNAQDIAVQAKITGSQDATLNYILPIFKITPFDTDNAGNAATYTIIVAFLSVLRAEVYGSDSNPKAKPGMLGLSSAKPAQDVMQWLMERPTPAPPFGATTYCSRCSSFAHMANECPNTDFVCSKCLASKVKWRQENAKTHMEGLCIFR
jgi:hypothetical protein